MDHATRLGVYLAGPVVLCSFLVRRGTSPRITRKWTTPLWTLSSGAPWVDFRQLDVDPGRGSRAAGPPTRRAAPRVCAPHPAAPDQVRRMTRSRLTARLHGTQLWSRSDAPRTPLGSCWSNHQDVSRHGRNTHPPDVRARPMAHIGDRQIEGEAHVDPPHHRCHMVGQRRREHQAGGQWLSERFADPTPSHVLVGGVGHTEGRNAGGGGT